MPGPLAKQNPFSALWQVVRYELLDSIRSRRAIVLIALYTLGASAASYFFAGAMARIEREAAQALGIDATEKVGGVTESLKTSQEFAEMIGRFSGDPELTKFLLELPPLAIFYGWLAFTFIPLLVVLLSSSRIAEQVWSGSVRYAVIRTPRLWWCIGKYLGQAIQILIALLVGAGGAWIVGVIQFDNFDALPTLITLLEISLRAWVYSLAFLGLSLGVSQMVRGPNIAVAVSVVVLTVVAITSAVSSRFAAFEGASVVWDWLYALMPSAHRGGLWRPGIGQLLKSAAAIIAIGSAYFLAGHYAFFARKDL